ncbi:MAG: hypothetical protein PQJ60_08775, partial [Spirochaetales bacterium]|nr:hypothetical protein [Spirochaetales bacterium]
MKNLLLIPLLLIMVLPLVVLIISAAGTTWEYPRLLPRFPADREEILIPRTLSTAAVPALSSLLYSLGTVLISLTITVLPARYLASAAFPGKELFQTILLLPAVISPFTFLMGVQFILL